jgi:hypothetical protein
MGSSFKDLAGLSEPATRLIEKVSDAVGGLYKPFQIVRVAKAEAEADLVRAESQIKITEVHRRAMHRFIEEEAKKQLNMEEITKQAIPLLGENSTPEKMSDDWITNFFDKCRIVSDQEMQQIWSRILAGEANNPGAFSKRTVNLLGDMEKADAQVFTQLCGFVCLMNKYPRPLVYELEKPIYADNGVNFGLLTHLETIGLIRFDNVVTFHVRRLGKKATVSYHEQSVELTFPNENENVFNLGSVLISQVGAQLYAVCQPPRVAALVDYLCDVWRQQGLSPTIC